MEQLGKAATGDARSARPEAVGRPLPAYLKALRDPTTALPGSAPKAPTELPYGCKRCGYSGFTRMDLPPGHPQFGRAQKCNCFLEYESTNYLERIEQESGINRAPLLQGMTWERFDPARAVPPPEEPPVTLWRDNPHLKEYVTEAWDDTAASVAAAGGYRTHLAKTVAMARAWVENPSTTWFVLSGMMPGTGKTHIAAAMRAARLARGLPALFMTVPDLLSFLKRGFKEGAAREVGGDYQRRWDKVSTYPFLILDDMGAERITDWVLDEMYKLIDGRHRANLPTVVTTNLPLDLLPTRLASRMQEGAYASPGDGIRRAIVRPVHAGDFRKRRG